MQKEVHVFSYLKLHAPRQQKFDIIVNKSKLEKSGMLCLLVVPLASSSSCFFVVTFLRRRGSVPLSSFLICRCMFVVVLCWLSRLLVPCRPTCPPGDKQLKYAHTWVKAPQRKRKKYNQNITKKSITDAVSCAQT